MLKKVISILMVGALMLPLMTVNTHAATYSDLTKIERELEYTIERINQVEEKLVKTDKKISTVKENKQELEKNYKKEKKQIEQDIDKMCNQESNPNEPTHSLIGTSYSVIANSQDIIEMHKEKETVIEDYKEDMVNTTKNEESLETKQDNLDDELSELKKKKTELKNDIREMQIDLYGRAFVDMNSDKEAQAILRAAYSQLGVPYVWGGTTPFGGLDCSGLTQYCHREAGISIGRTTDVQSYYGRSVSNPMPGDIVCYSGHVGIYIGNGQMIHAPKPGQNVKIADIYGNPWFVRYW